MSSVETIHKNAQMPADLAELYQGLLQELVWLHAKWTVFRQLYADPESVTLLNRSAPDFFGILQRVFVDDVLIAISRLTDPAQTRIKGQDKDNLTFERLVNAIDEAKFPELKAETRKGLGELMKRCDFARVNRNRRIAHTDLLTYLKRHPDSLPSITRKRVEEALEAMRALMNKVQAHFDGSSTYYEQPILPSDGRVLIAALKRAEAHRQQEEQLMRGRMSGSPQELTATSEEIIRAAEQLETTELDNVVHQMLALRARRKAPCLPKAESDLLLQINQGPPEERQRRYDELIAKRRAETLTPDEYTELLGLTKQMEGFAAKRLEHLAELARLRQRTLPQLMEDLGIAPPPYA